MSQSERESGYGEATEPAEQAPRGSIARFLPLAVFGAGIAVLAIVATVLVMELKPQDIDTSTTPSGAEEVVAEYTKSTELNPQDAETYRERGDAKARLGDREGAIADYTKAIELHPQFTVVYAARGDAKRSLEDYQGAIADFTKTIELNPQDAKAYNNRGAAKKALGDDKGAEADLEKAEQLEKQRFKEP